MEKLYSRKNVQVNARTVYNISLNAMEDLCVSVGCNKILCSDCLVTVSEKKKVKIQCRRIQRSI